MIFVVILFFVPISIYRTKMKKSHQKIIQGENAAAKAWIDLMGSGDGSSLKSKEGQLAERAPKVR